GSSFIVRLPLIPAPEAAPLAAPLVSTTAPVGSRRVLVVDDNVDAAESLALVLRASGHSVWVAFDGETALARATQVRPDVVVLDIGLPAEDGYSIARALRSRRATAGVTLVALTGYGQPEDVAKALEAGFAHHLVKPVDPERVLAIVAGIGASAPDAP
ncbi:MAG: response regulator, partial [Burkholderiales bacterium]